MALIMNKLLLAALALLAVVLWSQAPWLTSAHPAGTDERPSVTAPPDDLVDRGASAGAVDALESVTLVAKHRALPGAAALTPSGTDDPQASVLAAREPGEVAAEIALSVRVLLLDGTPVPEAQVEAQLEVQGVPGQDDAGYARVTTDDRGEFAFSDLADGEYTVSVDAKGLKGRDTMTVGGGPSGPSGGPVQRITVPRSGVELRIDALVFRAHVPEGINVDPEASGGHAMLSFGVGERPFHTSHYGGFRATPGSVITEILPTGPGYAMLVSRGNEN